MMWADAWILSTPLQKGRHFSTIPGNFDDRAAHNSFVSETGSFIRLFWGRFSDQYQKYLQLNSQAVSTFETGTQVAL